MQKNYCSPYEICIWEGSIDLVLNIISLVIINKLGVEIANIKYPDNFYELFDNYNINDFIVCFIILLVNFIYNIVILVTCNYFTPVHILITSMIKESYHYLKIKEDMTLNILGFFILLLITFMFLIFIEIIELNFCSISYNTKKNIEIRSVSEYNIDIGLIFLPQEEILIDEEDQ